MSLALAEKEGFEVGCTYNFHPPVETESYPAGNCSPDEVSPRKDTFFQGTCEDYDPEYRIGMFVGVPAGRVTKRRFNVRWGGKGEIRAEKVG